MSPMNQLRLKSDPTIGKSVEQELSGINVSSLENGVSDPRTTSLPPEAKKRVESVRLG